MPELNFDATTVAPDAGSFALPAGWYNAMIDQSEIKATKDGLGAMLKLRFNILDGKYANNKTFAQLNIKNASPVAQEIAFAQLSAIAHAVGVLQVKSSELLHGIPLKIKLNYKPAVMNEDGSEKYGAGNDVKAYKNINEAVPGGDAQPAAPAQVGAPPGGFGLPAPSQTQVVPAPPLNAPINATPAPAPTQPWQQPTGTMPPNTVPAQPVAPAWQQPVPSPEPQVGSPPPWQQPTQ
jgi:hypothetical protein